MEEFKPHNFFSDFIKIEKQDVSGRLNNYIVKIDSLTDELNSVFPYVKIPENRDISKGKLLDWFVTCRVCKDMTNTLYEIDRHIVPMFETIDKYVK